MSKGRRPSQNLHDSWPWRSCALLLHSRSIDLLCANCRRLTGRRCTRLNDARVAIRLPHVRFTARVKHVKTLLLIIVRARVGLATCYCLRCWRGSADMHRSRGVHVRGWHLLRMLLSSQGFERSDGCAFRRVSGMRCHHWPCEVECPRRTINVRQH